MMKYKIGERFVLVTDDEFCGLEGPIRYLQPDEITGHYYVIETILGYYGAREDQLMLPTKLHKLLAGENDV